MLFPTVQFAIFFPIVLAISWALMTRQFPRELTLVGMHGSLTEAEMTVPLLVG